MNDDILGSAVVFSVGPVTVTGTVITTWAIMLALVALLAPLRRRLALDPAAWQTALEGVVLAIRGGIEQIVPRHADRLLPFIGSLWIYLVIANLAGLAPGLHSPTRDLSATAALAMLVFASVHWYGLRIQGPRIYLRHYVQPNPILLPFHLISEVTRTVALAVRLFGNIMSLELAALLILLVAGFLVPVPILMLHVIEALVQAYIFGMLALVYIAGAIEARNPRSPDRTENSDR